MPMPDEINRLASPGQVDANSGELACSQIVAYGVCR